MEDIQIRTFPWSGELTQVSGLVQKLLEISKEIKSFFDVKAVFKICKWSQGQQEELLLQLQE